MVQAEQYKASIGKPEGLCDIDTLQVVNKTNQPQIITQLVQTNSAQLLSVLQFALIQNPGLGGIANQNVPQVSSKGMSFEDDEFSHLTCHIESNLKAKIKRGISLTWKSYSQSLRLFLSDMVKTAKCS